MNIIVTGGAGFIGSNFVKYWNKKYPNDLVVVYDKLTYAGNLDNLEGLKYEFVKDDIVNKDKLIETINKFNPEVIVNFAAETHVDRSIDGPDAFIKTNILGTYAILESLRSFPNIRLHHVSTDEVYGELPLDDLSVKFTEKSNFNPNSPYSASKASADLLVKSYTKTYGLKTTISNCSNNFGPNCHPEKFIPLSITRALLNEEIPLYGDGKQIRDWIHVKDHALGIDLILKKGQIGETYLLGGDGEKTNQEVLKFVIDYLDKSTDLIVYVGDRKGHDKRYAIDYSKAKKELGFEPQKDFYTRLVETIEWYKTNKKWWLESKKNADIIAQKYLAQRII